MVSLYDTQRGTRLREIAIEGRVDPTYLFIDLAYSPDSRYLAILFDHRAEIVSVPDGRSVGSALDARDWRAVRWLDERTVSGDVEQKIAYALVGERFATEPSGSEMVRCLCGDRLVRAEVCDVGEIRPEDPRDWNKG